MRHESCLARWVRLSAGAVIAAAGLVGMASLSLADEVVPPRPAVGDVRYGADRVLVRFRDATTADARAAAAARAGALATVFEYQTVPGLVCLRVPAGTVEAAVASLSAEPGVLYAELDYEVTAEAQNIPYGITLLNAPAAWSLGTGSGAVVAVLDTGVDLSHPDLPVPVLTQSFIDGEAVDDLHAHGTHCSGTVLAVDNTIGVVGVAPTAGLMIGKVLSNSGSGATSGVAAGVDWATMNGADVISMSLGGGGFSQSFSDICDAAVAANVLVVAAAGNSASSEPSYPASYDAVVSVSAIDSGKNPASFTNFGPTVDLCAPGVGVESTIPVVTITATWNAVPRAASAFSGGQVRNVAGPAIYCGTGLSASDFPATVNGKIAHIRRGGGTFRDKTTRALDAGAIGVIISNNTSGSLSGSLNGGFPFPVIGITQADGNNLQTNSGVQTTITFAQTGSSYASFSGTSMSCPHVAGAAALLYSQFGPGEVPVALIRQALEESAEDLGNPGRDDIFGHGLVNAQAAYVRLLELLPPSGCGSTDFDGDGDEGTDADIEAFFSVIGGGACPTATCGSVDFDGDGDEGTDSDIEAFFRVVGGGPCSL